MAPVPGEITAKQFETVALHNISGGILEDAFGEAMEEIMANIMDERTEAKAQRSISITIKLKPDESRSRITVSAEVTPTLAKRKLHEDMFTVSRGRSGDDLKVFRQRGDQVVLAEESVTRLSERRAN